MMALDADASLSYACVKLLYAYGSALYVYGSAPYVYGSAPYGYDSALYVYGSALCGCDCSWYAYDPLDRGCARHNNLMARQWSNHLSHYNSIAAIHRLIHIPGSYRSYC